MAQSQDELKTQVDNMISDAVYFSGKYVSPGADAMVYQAASGWVTTPKKKELWDITFGVNFNTFLVPKADRQFTISNSDFSFFTIENATTGTAQTVLGGKEYLTLTGTLLNNPVSVRTPQGVSMDVVPYAYFQGSMGLVYGTEVIGRWSPRFRLKNVNFQVYGIGLKHNLSQYFKKVESNKYHLSTAFIYSNEDLNVEFLDFQTNYGNLGLNALNSQVDTWQLQFNGSKEFKRFELMAGFIMNKSYFAYQVSGPTGSVEEIYPLQAKLNEKLKDIYEVKYNYIGEISGRYSFGKLFLQTSVAFGKFLNGNLSIQYEF